MSRKVTEEERIKAFKFLHKRYPGAFRLPGDIKPLEVNIQHKLMSDLEPLLEPMGIRRRAIYAALNHYVCEDEYKAARKILGNPRVDLDGNPSGMVTEKHLQLHREQNAKTQKEKRRRKAEQKAIRVRQLEKQRRLAEAEARKAEKVARREAAMKAQEEAAKRKAEKLKQASLRKPKRSVPKQSESVVLVKKPASTAKVIVKKKRTLTLPKKSED